MNKQIDPVLYLLFIGMVFFAIILIFCEHYFMSDGQMFQVMAGLLTGFGGAFFGRINPSKDKLVPGTTQITAVETPTETETK